MAFLVLIALALLALVMKLVAMLWLGTSTRTNRVFLFSPVLSPTSLRRFRTRGELPGLIRRAILLLGAVLLGYWGFWSLVRVLQVHGLLLNYLGVVILLLVTELLAALFPFLWLPGGRLLPALHRNPWRARSLADFWGRRWNLWFSDWFRYTMFTRMRRRPVLALLLVFAVSGLMHEWGINVPLYFVTGRNLFGSMMVYFLLQAAGMLFERRYLKNCPRMMMLFVWLVVVMPAPLVVNEGMLRTLYLWPEP